MALDGDEVADDDDCDMLCIPPTLWVNADYRHARRITTMDTQERKYLSCVSMVVILRLFLIRLLAMEDGRNVDSPH